MTRLNTIQLKNLGKTMDTFMNDTRIVLYYQDIHTQKIMSTCGVENEEKILNLCECYHPQMNAIICYECAVYK